MNILLVTMEMQVGGAETHIFELAKELKKRGNNVFVMSAGGRYADILEEHDIIHIYAPLKDKKPQNMLESYGILKKTIKEKNIDIVHAHARIPAFISGAVCKKLKIPFVTTVHGIYKVTPLLKLLTNWGSKTLAVSEDIKKQVMDVYNIKETDINTTVNGINTEIFCKGTNENVKKEIGIDNDKFHIVHVSRLDNMSSSVAEMLINISDELDEKIGSGAQIVIVGAGDKFDFLKEEAILHKNVILTGMRTDVSEILKNCDLFIGVSRAALEAMACELPIILAGNKDYGQGYMGILKEDKLEQAIDTNFCCRGCNEINKEDMISDILDVYNMSESEKDKLGEFARKVVVENYSINRMTEDALKMYKEVMK